MKRIIIPYRLLHGNWSNKCYIIYSNVADNTTTIPSIWRLIRRTLSMITDIKQ